MQQVAFTTDKITSLRAGITKLESVGHEAGVLVLHPDDWAGIETARNASGAFDLDGPVNRAERRAWGVQVVTSTAVAVG